MDMRLPVFTSILASLVIGGAAVAAPQALSDGALDGITAGTANAGSASGGAIVAHGSDATLTSTGAVELEGEAQSGAKGLNIVNSIESTVANGVNVWNGNIGGEGSFADGANFQVDQYNEVAQEQRRQASLDYYRRSEGNLYETGTEDSTRSTTSDVTRNTQNLDVTRETSTLSLTSDSSVDTVQKVIGQELQGGVGIAGSGDLHYKVEGFEVNYMAEALGGIDGDLVDLNGEVRITLDIELRPISIDFNGSICGVKIGSCDAIGSLDEFDETVVDKSVLVDFAEFLTEDETSSSTYTRDFRGPVKLEDAQAEYIVVDESNLTVNSSNVISLTGSAQSNLSGMNVVNAAGSAVANAVNIARTRSADLNVGSGRLLNLTQRNVIIHNR